MCASPGCVICVVFLRKALYSQIRVAPSPQEYKRAFVVGQFCSLGQNDVNVDQFVSTKRTVFSLFRGGGGDGSHIDSPP